MSAGVLNIQNATATGTTAGGVSVTTGAALELQGGIAVGAEALTLNGSGISSSGALRNISETNSYGRGRSRSALHANQFDSGTLTIDVASGSAITGTQNLTFGGAGNVTINDPIATSTGTLTKNGGGHADAQRREHIHWSDDRGSSGGADGGTLRLSGSGTLSNATTTIYGGTLDLNGTTQSITVLALGGGAAGSNRSQHWSR